MNITETLEQRIMRHEGFCALPKIDVAPMYVIGYGHDITQDQAENEYKDGITEDQAYQLLYSDLANVRVDVTNALPWISGISEIHREVLLEMAFQLGVAGLLLFKGTLAAAKLGDKQTVYDNMLASKWHSETPDRCEELANLWLDND